MQNDEKLSTRVGRSLAEQTAVALIAGIAIVALCWFFWHINFG